MQKEGRKEGEGERKLISTGTDMNTTAAFDITYTPRH